MSDPLAAWHNRVEYEEGPPPPVLILAEAHRTNCPDCLATVRLHRSEQDPSGWVRGVHHQGGCPSVRRIAAASAEPESALPPGGRVTGADVVHIIAPPVQMGPILRQRCLWCGEALIDVDLRRAGWPEAVGTWPPYSLVACTGAERRVVPFDLDPEPGGGCLVPAECCARRVDQQWGLP